MARTDSTGRDLQQQEVAARQRLAQTVRDDGDTRESGDAGMALTFFTAEGLQRTVGLTTPLPVRLVDGSDGLDVIGDGDEVGRAFNGTIGSTKGVVIFGADATDIARLLLTDKDGRMMVDDDSNHDMLHRILIELRQMNLHLASMTDADFSGIDTEES